MVNDGVPPPAAHRFFDDRVASRRKSGVCGLFSAAGAALLVASPGADEAEVEASYVAGSPRPSAPPGPTRRWTRTQGLIRG